MSNFEKDLNSLCQQMDKPTLQGPLPRWQRKANSSSSQNASSKSINSKSRMYSSHSGRSPLHDCTKSFLEGSLNLSQKGDKDKKTSSKPHSFIEPTQKGDRFIPSRANSKLDSAWHKIHEKPATSSETTLAEDDYRRRFRENLDQVMGIDSNDRILAYSSRPSAVEGFQNKTKVLYSSTKKANVDGAKSRHIPSAAEKVLDAPDLKDDFYLHLLDWGEKNQVAVGLGSSIYLWNASSGQITRLMSMENEQDYITSVKWTPDGEYLAVGDSTNRVQLWDVNAEKRLRNLRSHAGRVTSLSWNKHILTSGSEDTEIHYHDVRTREHHVNTLAHHSQPICGIEWDSDGDFLASGGNDNIVNVYDNRDNSKPIHSFSEHQAGVKALAWCPWHKNVLATGGGSADRHIRLWNTNTGVCTKAVDTKSQVCMLKWSTHYKELLSSHGYAQHQLTLWSFPSMTWIKDLLGHTARVLYLTLSPDGQTACSAGADETLRLWKCFQFDPKTNKKKGLAMGGARSLFGKEIR